MRTKGTNRSPNETIYRPNSSNIEAESPQMMWENGIVPLGFLNELVPYLTAVIAEIAGVFIDVISFYLRIRPTSLTFHDL